MHGSLTAHFEKQQAGKLFVYLIIHLFDAKVFLNLMLYFID